MLKKIKNIYYQKKILPIFLNEVTKNNNSILSLIEINDESVKISLIIKENLFIFEKFKTEKLKYTNFCINELLLHKEIYENLFEYIDKWKKQAHVTSTQNIIDHININIKDLFNYYNFDRKEVYFIYETLLSDKELYKSNNQQIIIEHENLRQTWMD